MTTAADNSWMPSGRHQVILGPSLTRTLKARQSGPIKNTKVKAEREFYSFRYNFKPESIDVTRSGTIETQRPKEEGGPSTVTVVRPSQQNDSGISFVGTENIAKEFECVLVYDEGAGTITLEKIDSYITLNHDPKPTLAPRHVGSPAPAAPPRVSASSSASSSHAHQAAVKQEEEESEGEIPETKLEPKPEPKVTSRPPPVPNKLKSRRQPASVPAIAPASASIPAPIPASASAAATPASIASANSRPAHGLPSKPTPVVPSKLKGKAPTAPSQTPSIPAKSPNKRERPVEPEEETLEIRRPQPVPKKPKIVKKEVPRQQPPPPKVALSFPDSSSAVSLPSALVSAAPAVPDPITAAAAAASDSDDGWEDLMPPVATPASPVTAAAAPPSGPSRAIIMEEIDEFIPPPPHKVEPAMDVVDAEAEDVDMASEMAMLEELNNQLLGGLEQEEDDEDFLAGAVSPVQERQPISLSEFVGGSADFGDDDEYSSSDDSDED
ncbi:RNA polymerase II transcription elongation factor-domain-containing protein [Ganoderma leucocontextum]|nr:RNA polymerase II transcription elongation factor-domain-containing protein [Ganoderma leucocontextum]